MGILFQNNVLNNANSEVNSAMHAKDVHTSMANDSAKLLIEYLQGKANGQGIMAEIKGMTGSQVQLLLGNNSMIQANVEGNFNFNIGQKLIFQLQGNSGDKISISPLFSNNAMQENVYKAIEAANLPVKEDTVTLVKAMMDSKLPIDLTSLQSMNREMVTNPNTSIDTLVSLKNFNIPINKDSIVQFEQYKQHEHHIVDKIQNFIDELPNQFTNLAKSVVPELINNNISNETLPQESNLADKAVDFKEMVEFIKVFSSPNNELDNVRLEFDKEMQNFNNIDKSTGNIVDNVIEKYKPQILELFDGNESLANQKLLGKLAEMIEKTTFSEDIAKDIGNSKEFSKLLKDVIGKQWLLSPKEVDGGAVEDLYERLNKQTAKLMDIVNDLSNQNSSIGKEVNNLKQNIDFLNQINQFANYVQIPLKMSGGNANAQLYVYADKDKLKGKDDNFSAALQLNMDNLGCVNVYVTMQGKNVETNFTLQDDETLDFISNNIDILNRKIEKLGYNITTKLIVDEDINEISDEIFKLGVEPEEKMSIHYSFDMKA